MRSGHLIVGFESSLFWNYDWVIDGPSARSALFFVAEFKNYYFFPTDSYVILYCMNKISKVGALSKDYFF